MRANNMFLSLHGEMITSSPGVTLLNAEASAENKSHGRQSKVSLRNTARHFTIFPTRMKPRHTSRELGETTRVGPGLLNLHIGSWKLS